MIVINDNDNDNYNDNDNDNYNDDDNDNDNDNHNNDNHDNDNNNDNNPVVSSKAVINMGACRIQHTTDAILTFFHGTFNHINAHTANIKCFIVQSSAVVHCNYICFSTYKIIPFNKVQHE